MCSLRLPNVIIPHVSCPAAGKPDLYLTLNISTSVQGNMLEAGMGYWLVIVFIRALFLGDIGREGRMMYKLFIGSS